ncbi:MAG: nucleotidyltransferase family protein [Patescibacteria group bacterium]|nr:nucleotidyltransferase family protein [Patescibacteria group bacterium]
MNKIILKIIPILKKYGVSRASLFGSLVRGDNTNKSDIDILIEPAKGTTLFDLAGMQIELQKAIKKPIDLVTYSSINPKLKKIILKDEKLIYEKKIIRFFYFTFWKR